MLRLTFLPKELKKGIAPTTVAAVSPFFWKKFRLGSTYKLFFWWNRLFSRES